MKNKFLLLALLFCGVLSAQETYWNPVSGIQDNMTVLAEVLVDNAQPSNILQLELGVFCGDECRGACLPEDLGDGLIIYVLTAKGRSDGEELTFRLYDHGGGGILDLVCNTTLPFEKDGLIGFDTFYQILFTTPGPTVQTWELPITGHANDLGGGYYLIAPPCDVDPANQEQVTNILSGNYDFYYFDQKQDLEWVNYESHPFSMTSCKGYLYSNEATVTLTFTGVPYSGDGKVTLEKKDVDFSGWNLVGNPFNGSATIDRPYYMLTGESSNLFVPKTSTDAIALMQGVFVMAASDGEEMQFTASGSGHNKESLMFKVSRNRGDILDRAIVQFDGGRTLPKLMFNPDQTKLYIPEGNEQFAVVNSSRENSMPVNFKAEENGTYTFGVEVDNLEMEYLHLIDNLTGTDVNLLDNPAYSFEARTTDFENRFTLVFRAMTGVEENSQRNFCFVNGGNLNFCMDVQGSQVSIIDMAGRTVMQQVMDGNSVNLPALSQGVYVVNLSNNDNTLTQKIVIK